MTHTRILSEIQDIMRRVLDNGSLNIVDATTAKDVPEWDSLSHIELIVAIEKHFRLKFTLKEVQSFHNVGEMCEAIAQKAG
jgi:acyl carrier protein